MRQTLREPASQRVGIKCGRARIFVAARVAQQHGTLKPRVSVVRTACGAPRRAHGWMPRKLGAYGAGEDLEASNFDVAARRARDKRKATRTEHAHKVSCAVLVRIACSARTRRDATTCCPIPLHQRGRAHVEVTDRAARYSATCVVTDGRAHAGEQLEGRHARTPGLFTHAARGNVVISFCSTQ